MREMINVSNGNNGILTVTSREVAENFDKEHKNILRDIRTISQLTPADVRERLFIEVPYQHPQNQQWYKEYLITRDGFSLLVMGFTGHDAMAWKIKYIEAFNKMEEALKNVVVDPKAKLLVDIYNGGQAGIIASKALADEEVREATAPLIKEIEEAQPAIKFTDEIKCSDGNILVRELAKTLSSKDRSLGEVTLYAKLRQMGLVFRTSTEPTQFAIKRGYLEYEERVIIIRTTGKKKTVFTTKVTPKGQVYIANRI